MSATHQQSNDQHIDVTAEDGLAFFRLWTMTDLKEATRNIRRAAQARWSIIAIVFLLWRWAIENRKITFEAVLPKSWPILRKLMESREIAIAKEPVSAEAFVQARKQVGMEPLWSLYRSANKKMESQFDSMSRYKGLRLWAIDGSWLNLPSRSDLERAFGRPYSEDGQKKTLPAGSDGKPRPCSLGVDRGLCAG